MTRKCQASFNDDPEGTDLSKPVDVLSGLRPSDGSLRISATVLGRTQTVIWIIVYLSLFGTDYNRNMDLSIPATVWDGLKP